MSTLIAFLLIVGVIAVLVAVDKARKRGFPLFYKCLLTGKKPFRFLFSKLIRSNWFTSSFNKRLPRFYENIEMRSWLSEKFPGKYKYFEIHTLKQDDYPGFVHELVTLFLEIVQLLKTGEGKSIFQNRNKIFSSELSLSRVEFFTSELINFFFNLSTRVNESVFISDDNQILGFNPEFSGNAKRITDNLEIQKEQISKMVDAHKSNIAKEAEYVDDLFKKLRENAINNDYDATYNTLIQIMPHVSTTVKLSLVLLLKSVPDIKNLILVIADVTSDHTIESEMYQYLKRIGDIQGKLKIENRFGDPKNEDQSLLINTHPLPLAELPTQYDGAITKDLLVRFVIMQVQEDEARRLLVKNKKLEEEKITKPDDDLKKRKN